MNFKHPLILGSSSPRRQYLMKEVGFVFTIHSPPADEDFPSDMNVERVPSYLAKKKAKSLEHLLTNDEVILTSDTVVLLHAEILNKPSGRSEAIDMLSRLSGNTHTVITAVYIHSKIKSFGFDDRTNVTFNTLKRADIESYVDHFKPFDKAGAYGAQDCLPVGINPCSEEEIAFLKKINKPDLIEKTFTHKPSGTGLDAIHAIEGSYFTVMGLPVHKVYERLQNFETA